MKTDQEGVSLEDKYKRVRSIIEMKGIEYYNKECFPLPDSVIVPEKNRGVFVHDSEAYYADDCSIIQVMGF